MFDKNKISTPTNKTPKGFYTNTEYVPNSVTDKTLKEWASLDSYVKFFMLCENDVTDKKLILKSDGALNWLYR